MNPLMERIDFPARIQRLQARMKEEGLAAYVATRQASLSWLLGAFAPWRTAVIVPAEGEPCALLWRLDAERLRSETWMKKTMAWGNEGSFVTAIVQVLSEFGITHDRVGLDLGSSVTQQVAPGLLLASEYMALTEALPHNQWVNAVPMIESILQIKDEIEIEYLRRAAQIADIGMQAAQEALTPGITENALAGVVEKAIRQEGSEWSWSSTQGTEVGSGYRTAYRSGVTQPATEKKIETGEMVIVDLHPMVGFYLGDLAGNFYLGSDVPDSVRKIADCFERTVSTLLNLLRPGMVIDSVVRKAYAVIEESGLGEWGVKAFGHGLGTCARTPPYMTLGNQARLESQMVLALGTHIYQPGVGGMRLEWPVQITENGCEPLSNWEPKLHIVHP